MNSEDLKNLSEIRDNAIKIMPLVKQCMWFHKCYAQPCLSITVNYKSYT